MLHNCLLTLASPPAFRRRLANACGETTSNTPRTLASSCLDTSAHPIALLALEANPCLFVHIIMRCSPPSEAKFRANAEDSVGMQHRGPGHPEWGAGVTRALQALLLCLGSLRGGKQSNQTSNPLCQSVHTGLVRDRASRAAARPPSRRLLRGAHASLAMQNSRVVCAPRDRAR